MFAQSFLLLTLFIVWYYGNLNVWFYGFTISMTVYWLPKWLIIKPLNCLFPSVIFRRNRKKKTIYLTFDDAPYGQSTEKIVELLNRYSANGTFFVISDYISSDNRQTLVDALKSGHQLCNHGKTNSAHALKSLQKWHTEISVCQEYIDNLYELAQLRPPKDSSRFLISV